MEALWLKEYPEGVPAEIDLDPGESLVSMLAHSCARFADRPALANLGHEISYGDLDDLSARFAGFLRNDLGLRDGDRVALMLPNLIQYPVALFGVLRAGLVAVNVNPLYTAPELAHQLKDSGARAIVALENSAHVVEQALAETEIENVVLTAIGDALPVPKRWVVNLVVRYVKRLVPAHGLRDARRYLEAVASDQPAYRHPTAIQGSDLAILQYTGGTTGVSKGAMLSHSNLLANVVQINTWFAPRTNPGEEIVLTALPLYHVYALTCNLLAYIAQGGLVLLITDPRDLNGLIAEMKRWPFTAMTGVNTLYQVLADHPDLESVDFSHLKLVSAGGMAVREATAKSWADRTGTYVLEGYGLSETSPVLTSNPTTITGYTGSIGLPLPSTEISLRDDEDNEVPLGQPGELCARGPQVMTGYWKRDQATRDAMTGDGFFCTGDIAVVDEKGWFRIVDRKKDMIDVSGFKVFPNEVEHVLTMHPDIVEAACVGVPDARTDEAVKVFVVTRPGVTMTENEVIAWSRKSLVAYKVPDQVEFRETLPKSNVGKVLRRELREAHG